MDLVISEMSFENIEGRRMDACLYYKVTVSYKVNSCEKYTFYSMRQHLLYHLDQYQEQSEFQRQGCQWRALDTHKET